MWWTWFLLFFLGRNGMYNDLVKAGRDKFQSVLTENNIRVSFSFNFFCLVPFRQCRCILREQLHLARVEDLLQRLLKCAIDRICALRVPAVEDGKKRSEIDDLAGSSADVESDKWSQPEQERLFLAVGKIFQLPFPFYQVRKIHLLRQVCNRLNFKLNKLEENSCHYACA